MRNYQRITHWSALTGCAGAMTLYLGGLFYNPTLIIIGIPFAAAGIGIALWAASHKEVNDVQDSHPAPENVRTTHLHN